ncbi:serine hydrolase domain-containing protein [Streptosporangium carneum]|nr:serine hydrolase domain-containing protein [Streptosporangium carneum]
MAAVGVLTAVALSAGAPAFAAAAGPADPQTMLDTLTKADGFTGALLHTSDGGTLTSGVAERGTDTPMVGAEGRFRIASVTKPVMAVAVLQLVAQGRIELDAPLERYLPGVVRGKGGDGRKITVRQVLQQTSGLPEYVFLVDWNKPFPDTKGYLALALAQKPTGKPGERWAYSNTNYLVAGMIVNRVTGQDFRVVTARNIFGRLGLKGTYWPRRGETGLRGPHARFYGTLPTAPDKEGDVTALPGYELGASGGLVSTPADMNRFWEGVFNGELVPDATLRAMFSPTVATADPERWPLSERYGLGLGKRKLPCGGTAWLHGGDVPGVTVLSGRSERGRTATVYVTGSADTPRKAADLIATFDAAMCAG